MPTLPIFSVNHLYGTCKYHISEGWLVLMCGTRIEIDLCLSFLATCVGSSIYYYLLLRLQFSVVGADVVCVRR